MPQDQAPVGVTDDMVVAARTAIESEFTRDTCTSTEALRAALAAALAVAPDPGSPYWLCLVRDDGVRMFTRRRYCEHYECPGPHHVLVAGPQQPLPDAST